MKSFVALALAASVLATPMPQAATPAGCSSSRSGSFQISVVNVTSTSKRSVEKRQASGILTLTLNNGVLKDAAGRTGSIVANHQFQFDNPVQADAIATSGFSVCSNGSLASGGSAIFYQCLSGSFYNLYDQSQGGQCNPIYLVASGTAPVSQATDGQPAASTAARVSQISDGQVQASSARPAVSQISDGQPQVPTGRPVSQISDGQPQVPTGRPVSQISDGQPQVPTGKATPRPVVSQISDGQVQVPTARVSSARGPVISQISDGQPQVPIATPRPTSAPGPVVSQISDGQLQVPTPKPAPVVSQISDGQPQVPKPTANVTVPSAPAVSQFTGAAATPMAAAGAFAAALFGVAALL